MLDFTSLWAFVQTHRDRIQLALIGLLLFAGGWQLGRVMSPYYTAQPIIFEDRQCESCASSGGSLEELSELEAASAPQVAGEESTSSGQAEGQFVASVNSDLFHHYTCGSASRISEVNKIWFTSVDEAIAAGYAPSKCAQDLGY